MTINNVECVTLGHGFQEPVVKHPFFGTEKVSSFKIMFNDEDEAQMLAIRSSFNSSGLLNPSKIFPTGAKCGESLEHDHITKDDGTKVLNLRRLYYLM